MHLVSMAGLPPVFSRPPTTLPTSSPPTSSSHQPQTLSPSGPECSLRYTSLSSTNYPPASRCQPCPVLTSLQSPIPRNTSLPSLPDLELLCLPSCCQPLRPFYYSASLASRLTFLAAQPQPGCRSFFCAVNKAISFNSVVLHLFPCPLTLTAPLDHRALRWCWASYQIISLD